MKRSKPIGIVGIVLVVAAVLLALWWFVLREPPPPKLESIEPLIRVGMSKAEVQDILTQSRLDRRWVATENTVYAIERDRQSGSDATTTRQMIIRFNDRGEVAAIRHEAPGEGR